MRCLGWSWRDNGLDPLLAVAAQGIGVIGSVGEKPPPVSTIPKGACPDDIVGVARRDRDAGRPYRGERVELARPPAAGRPIAC